MWYGSSWDQNMADFIMPVRYLTAEVLASKEILCIYIIFNLFTYTLNTTGVRNIYIVIDSTSHKYLNKQAIYL